MSVDEIFCHYYVATTQNYLVLIKFSLPNHVVNTTNKQLPSKLGFFCTIVWAFRKNRNRSCSGFTITFLLNSSFISYPYAITRRYIMMGTAERPTNGFVILAIIYKYPFHVESTIPFVNFTAAYCECRINFLFL